ncbi:MAG: glycine oxidase ThiO [Acidimicrobiales bacterium]|nr:glycine oxidase ThiO [Acidimicrobiales bacterium]
MATRAPTDVVVIGGGVIGLSIAWTAAVNGMAVTVVDPAPGRGASWAAAGMLAPVGEAYYGEEALIALNLRASREWPEFARALETASGESVGYRADGTLLVAMDPSDQAATDDVLGFHLGHGLGARRLSARECRGEEPLLAPGIKGGAELADDHQVDNRRVVDALAGACRAHRVAFSDDEASDVDGGDGDGGRVTGVTLRHGGRLAAGAVVVAAGCRSGQIGGIPEAIRPPVRPVKGITVRLRGDSRGPSLRRTVRGMVHGRSCYLVPRRDGTLVVGATVEEQGFDLSVRIGAVSDLLDDARQLVPALDEYELLESTAGLRPGSPDNAPIVGQTHVAGLIMATGHYRNGILLAPVTAYEVTRILLSGAVGLIGPDGHEEAAGQAGSAERPVKIGDRLHETSLMGAFAPFGPDRFAPAGGAGRAPLSVGDR